MEYLTPGTIEHLLVNVADRTGGLTTLPPTTRFEVRDADGVVKQAASAPTISGMQAACLIDTTVPSVWAEAYYDLYLWFPNVPETPRIGPIRFAVSA